MLAGDMPPLVSVVIAVYNQENTIKSSLESILGQTYPNMEVIIVDDGSTDNTSTILEKIVGKTSLQLIRIPHSGRSYARNLGFRNSNGSIVAFAEGDATYAPNYLVECVKFFDDPTVGGAFAQMQIFNPNTFLSKLLYAERQIFISHYEPFSAWVYRREVFEKVNGFDETIDQAEDRDLALRVKKMGYRIAYEPTILWWHKAPDFLMEYLRKSFNSGRLRITFYLKYPSEVPYGKILALLFAFPLLILSIFNLFFLILLWASAGVVLFAKLLQTLKNGWNVCQKRRYLFIIPLLSFLRNLASTLGTIIGFAEKSLGK